MQPDSKPLGCSMRRDYRRCSFCNGDGYAIEHDRLNACGVCETTGIRPLRRRAETA